MVIFAFCLLGLFIALIRMGGEKIVGAGFDAKFNRVHQKRDQFINSITVPVELQTMAESLDDISDVIDDIRYLYGSDMSVETFLQFYKNTPFIKGSLNWTNIIACIRLSRMGKIPNYYSLRSGMRTARNDVYHYTKVRSFYDLIANNLNKFGLQVTVTEKPLYNGNDNYIDVNIDKFQLQY